MPGTMTEPGVGPVSPGDLAVHAAWRTSPEVAVEVALAATVEARTPEPLRQARRLARTDRASEVL
jgi:endonuclease V-like protein UPF0215 family